MDHKVKFESLAQEGGALIELFLFGWRDETGNGGDYGLNVGPYDKTFTTLISTTYMFQPEPKFVLHCRPFKMTQAQFDYLQDHDLDTEDFLSNLGPLPEVFKQLDLSLYNDVQAALQGLNDLTGD